MNLLSSSLQRYREFSVRRGILGQEWNIHSNETMRQLMLRHAPRRFAPVVALLRRGFGRRVLITSDGEEWQRTQQAVASALHAGTVAAEYGPVIEQTTREALAQIAERDRATSGTGVDLDVEPFARTIGTSVLGFVLFGRALPLTEAARIEADLNVALRGLKPGGLTSLNTLMAHVYRTLRIPTYQSVLLRPGQIARARRLVQWIEAELRKLEASQTKVEIFERLQKRFATLSIAKRRRAIAAEYAMFFIAGVETMAASVAFAVAEIAANPEMLRMVQEEARRFEWADGAAELTARYPYIQAVYRETLRRHTIVPTLLRESSEDMVLQGTSRDGSPKCPVHMAKGAVLRYLIVAGHLNRSVWPNPNRFQPDRFLTPLNGEQASHYMPFGVGPQRCPGHAMATNESTIILAELFRLFDVEPRPLPNGIPVERSAMFTNRPVGVKVRVHAAQPAQVN
jgi:cytochrome P450